MEINKKDMGFTKQLANHLRAVHFGVNWTESCMREHVKDITWEQATTSVYGLNTIATLTCHATYYVTALLEVLEGKPLNANEKSSFNVPMIRSQHEWEQVLEKAWLNAEKAAQLLEQLPDSILLTDFAVGKQGNYYHHIQGNIEHMHYHLGQIVLVKKLLAYSGKQSVEQTSI
jgi:hypothetical protein